MHVSIHSLTSFCWKGKAGGSWGEATRTGRQRKGGSAPVSEMTRWHASCSGARGGAGGTLTDSSQGAAVLLVEGVESGRNVGEV